jgi:amino acid transporter
MIRILTPLAILVILGLVGSGALGIVLHYQDAAGASGEIVFLAHFSLGLFTAIATLLVHCIIFTYFLGTGRWVKEVGSAYALADEPLPRLTRELKRKTFPPALAAMLVTIAAVAAGAGVQNQLPQWPWQIHASLAAAALLVNLWAFRLEYRNVEINMGVIADVMQAVERIRAERGLPTNRDALEAEDLAS